MTDQIKQATTAWLKGLAEARDCLSCDGDGSYFRDRTDELPCRECNGSGLDPRTEMFRVACEEYPGCDSPAGTGTRPLTPAEAEARGLEMLDILSRPVSLTIELKRFTNDSWAVGIDGINIYGDTQLLAILAAVGSVVGVEVTQ